MIPLKRMFPNVKVCSEIIDVKNMRFVQFRPDDFPSKKNRRYSDQILNKEKVKSKINFKKSIFFKVFTSSFVNYHTSHKINKTSKFGVLKK